MRIFLGKLFRSGGFPARVARILIIVGSGLSEYRLTVEGVICVPEWPSKQQVGGSSPSCRVCPVKNYELVVLGV